MSLDAYYDFQGETNFKAPFETLMKTASKDYINYLSAAYEARDILSDDAFCKLNHVPSITILKKILKIG